MCKRLLVSVRGPIEARIAAEGGAHIIDAEYPLSALGSAYPLNILAIREATPLDRPVSTNIGEKQFRWSTASQAALGVALAGADIVKVGLGGFRKGEAEVKGTEVMRRTVRNVKRWFPRTVMIATLFADFQAAGCVDPKHGPKVTKDSGAAGLLIDTYNKGIGKNLIDYLPYTAVKGVARDCHSRGLECWVAGSLNEDHLPRLWRAGADVVCVRGAACGGGKERGGIVDIKRVRRLVRTIRDP